MTETVYVVILNFNGWKDTLECLESVLRCDCGDLQVVVVDNGSTDGSVQRIADWARGDLAAPRTVTPMLDGLTWPPVPKPIALRIQEPFEFRGDGPAITVLTSAHNLGFAGGNNLALRALAGSAAKGHALLLNNDMIVDPGLVKALLRAINADTTLAAVGGLILDYWKPDLVQSIGGARMSRVGNSFVVGPRLTREEARAHDGETLGYVCGGCLLIGLDTLRRVGVMEEAYFLYAEDADWGERMRGMGYRLSAVVDGVTWHKGSHTTGEKSPFQDYYLVRSALMFVRRHAAYWFPLAAINSIYRHLAPKIVRLQWRRVGAVLRAYADYARGR